MFIFFPISWSVIFTANFILKILLKQKHPLINRNKNSLKKVKKFLMILYSIWINQRFHKTFTERSHNLQYPVIKAPEHHGRTNCFSTNVLMFHCWAAWCWNVSADPDVCLRLISWSSPADITQLSQLSLHNETEQQENKNKPTQSCMNQTCSPSSKSCDQDSTPLWHQRT